MYENYPLWFTILTELGFKVMLSGALNHELFETGMESIPSENVCYPAKLAHGHIEWLLDKGVKTIFYPCVELRAANSSRRRQQLQLPGRRVLPAGAGQERRPAARPRGRFLDPFVNLADPEQARRAARGGLRRLGVTLAEAEAVAAGFAEDAQVQGRHQGRGRPGAGVHGRARHAGIVLAGRPYHVDPEVNHGIPEMITSARDGGAQRGRARPGMVELRLERPLRVRDQWTYHSRLYEAGAQVATEPDLQLVQLNSFGCGLDAVTTDQVQEILEAAGDVYTVLKIDEVSNLGAARIRLRSLQAATAERRPAFGPAPRPRPPRAEPGLHLAEKQTHTLYAPQMAPIHFRLLEPVLRRVGLRRQAPRARVQRGRRGRAEVRQQRRLLPGDHGDRPADQQVHLRRRRPRPRLGGDHPDRRHVPGHQLRGLLRKGLKDAGFAQVPVLAVSAQGLERTPASS
jgi:predicted nucleotide-binding protein (sugar kinase/HSP70/actin superfamily)